MNNLSISNTYISDIKRVLNTIKNYQKLNNKSIFITGCNGLICSSVVDLLIQLNNEYNLNLKLFLASRDINKTKERFLYNHNCSLIFFKYDALKPLICNEKIDYFIHGASPASPDLFISNPVDTMIANIFGIKEILDKAIINNSRTIYISSSEVYGKFESSIPIPETASGIIDILNPRSSYGQSKRAAETLCSSYLAQYKTDVVIVRPGHIFGPTANRSDRRVSSSFMYDAVDGKDLVLKSKGEQIRSYTYCLDCASAIIYVLLNGITGEAYNISNPNSICNIADMAKTYAKAANVELKFELPKDEEKKSFNPMNNSSLNSSKLETLGWKPNFTKEEGFNHSIKILKEILNEEN